jgi:hypothetical protein
MFHNQRFRTVKNISELGVLLLNMLMFLAILWRIENVAIVAQRAMEGVEILTERRYPSGGG